MVDAKTRFVALTVFAGLVLSGCNVSQKDPGYPHPPSAFTALFSLPTATSPYPFVPFPFDPIAFATSTDGTIDLPPGLDAPPYAIWGSALDQLDGFSTIAPATTSFSEAIDGSSLSGATVHMVEINEDNFGIAPETPPGGVSPVLKVLEYGVDYTASVDEAIDSAGKVLKITPLKPLEPSTSSTHIGYIIWLTNGIRNTKAVAATTSELYQSFKDAPANCSTVTDPTNNQLCQLTKAQLAIGAAVGVDPASVVLSWSYSTESVDPTFDYLAAFVPAQPIGVVPTGMTTAAVGAYGHADIYVGTTQVPYYLAAPENTHDPVVLSYWWVAENAFPLDPTSFVLSRFNPIPHATTTVTIPVLVTVPNANAAEGTCVKPANGWPILIFQHGFTRSREDALAIADAAADGCMVVAAIDAPLHGVTNTADPFYQAANERTFNLDLVNNDTGAPGPDGKIDPSGGYGGTTFMNLTSPLVTRDNLRQAEADQIVFTKTVANLDLSGDGASDIDPTRIHYVGQSMGGIIGGTHVHFAHDLRTATLNVPGGNLTLLIQDSPTFSAQVRPVLAQQLTLDSILYEKFFNEFQAVVDSADPANHLASALAQNSDHLSVHMQMVIGDQVVPNSSANYLINSAGLTKVSSNSNLACGGTPIVPGTGAYTAFTAGEHGSLLNPATSLPVTVEMQTEVVKFALTADLSPCGATVVITDPTYVQP